VDVGIRMYNMLDAAFKRTHGYDTGVELHIEGQRIGKTMAAKISLVSSRPARNEWDEVDRFEDDFPSREFLETVAQIAPRFGFRASTDKHEFIDMTTGSSLSV
jgi:hypothetical protein